MATRLLEGDSALVTGARQGIGQAIVQALKEEGAQVLGVDLDGADLQCDLTDSKGLKNLVDEAVKRLGKVSIFVHCASPPRREADTILKVSEATWREMLEVNLNAGFLLSQAFGRHMVENKIKGRMLIATSLHAEAPRNLPHYSASKGGQQMLVRELARALGPHGIRVNAIVPGAVPGGGFKGLPGLVEKIPLGRLGKPADVAAMAIAVLSERFGGYVTGASIVVDGGLALYNWIDAHE